jgi:gamma-glutamyltranspeptidase/glutathione hydrolase
MLDGGVVYLESGFDYTEIRKLIMMGHTIQYEPLGFGGYQAIMRDPETGVLYGASESRKDGQAAGW